MTNDEPSPRSPRPRGERLIAWILSHHRLVLALSLVAAVAGAVAAAHLPVKADFSALLPPSTESVRHLDAIQQRVRAFGTAFILVEADDPAVRLAASDQIRKAVERLDPSLVTRVTADDGPLRRFVWKNRHLFASVEDLTRTRDALEARIKDAKLRANPLYIDLDDEDDDEPSAGNAAEPGAEAGDAAQPDPAKSGAAAGDAAKPDPEAADAAKPDPAKSGAAAGDAKPGAAPTGEAALDDLRERLEEAEARATSPTPFASRNGRLQLLIVQASFPASQIGRTKVLAGELERIRAEAERSHPGVRVGLTGDIATTLSEQRSITVGMLQSGAVTALLCALLLIVAYRSVAGILSVLWALSVGTVATLGFAWLLIGHLNIATAFLLAIVVGNGINPGLILLSRFRDELARGDEKNALARAMAGAARGTLAASLTAAIAYASLAITDFRGFRHFGIINGIGMALCWIAAFTVLPAALTAFHRRRPIRFRPPGTAYQRLTRLLPQNPTWAAALGFAATLAAGWGAYRYLAGEPLEEDWRRLRSDSAEILEQRAWNDRISTEFDQGFNRNLSGRFAIVVSQRDQVRPLVEGLRAHDRGKQPDQVLLSEVRSLDDVVPERQEEKLALLAQIRQFIDRDLLDEVEGEDREEIERLRPPDDLRLIGDKDVPEELAWPFIERDGTVGRIIMAAKSDRFDGWNVTDLVQFSGEVRELPRPEGTLLGGQAFVFADMLRAMERDGPRAILLSLVGSVLTILLLLGRGRHGWVTIICTLSGVAGMVALAGVAGIKINFLDFIALPISIGIGADYAANIAARERDEPHRPLGDIVAESGGAVFLCSLTTIIGYGSLLVSDNAGIRSFGLAAILGEAACLTAAILLCPALLRLWRRDDRPRP